MATAIFYGTNTGNCKEIAKTISTQLGKIETFNFDKTKVEKINEYDKIILGASTWGNGDLNDDWESVWDDFVKVDFSNKTVAIFGLGDQESYGDEFADAVGIVYEHLKDSGAKIIGFTSVDGYYHDSSRAQIDDKFVGLILDEDNQSELTEQRVKTWLESIKSEIL